MVRVMYHGRGYVSWSGFEDTAPGIEDTAPGIEDTAPGIEDTAHGIEDMGKEGATCSPQRGRGGAAPRGLCKIAGIRPFPRPARCDPFCKIL